MARSNSHRAEYHNACEPILKPKPNLNALIQYLEWALMQAYKAENPESKKVHITLDLERLRCTAQLEDIES